MWALAVRASSIKSQQCCITRKVNSDERRGAGTELKAFQYLKDEEKGSSKGN